MTCSKAKLESNGDRASYFRLYWTGIAWDESLPARTMLQVSFGHILISLTSSMCTANWMKSMHNTSNWMTGFLGVCEQLMCCLTVLTFFFLQYLTNAKDVTSSLSSMSKPTLMIHNILVYIEHDLHLLSNMTFCNIYLISLQTFQTCYSYFDIRLLNFTFPSSSRGPQFLMSLSLSNCDIALNKKQHVFLISGL
jgi:hypothetical protein